MTIPRMYLALLAAAVVAACILRLLDAGVAGFGSAYGLGEISGTAGALFLVASLVSTVLVLLYRKRIASAASPTAVGIVVLAAFSFTCLGIEAGQTLVKHVDRREGFSVHYGADWVRVEPNENETKLVVVSPAGNRCWVIVVGNQGSTGENAKEIVKWLINNGSEFEKALAERFGGAYVASVRPVLMSGNHDSALFSYSYRYRSFDIDATIAVLEAHTPTKGFTYKVGCSTVSDGDLTTEFKNGTEMFFKSFMVIPRQD